MLNRLLKPQIVQVTPTAAVAGQSNAFGDEPLFPSRATTTFEVPVQLEWTTRRFQGGQVEHDPTLKAIGLSLKRDAPAWTPRDNDLMLVDGTRLYLANIQPAFANYGGIWDGWRFELTDLLPELGPRE